MCKKELSKKEPIQNPQLEWSVNNIQREVILKWLNTRLTESEASWSEFFSWLKRRGLCGVEMILHIN